MSNFSWTCPHCSKPTTITKNDEKVELTDLYIDNSDGELRLLKRFIVCPNPECKKVTFEIWLHKRTTDDYGSYRTGDLIKHWQLVPTSSAKSFPNYIPKAILADYEEACLIRDLSPKASATLARRCIQGIIRDFWQVKPARLIEEIESIKDKIDPLVWESIDTIRKVGNIGAHMEKDINLMVEVDPEEAELLLGLIEMLLKEWYVLREERKRRLERIVQVGVEKQLEKRSKH
ncbi:DUF4145 domain-containing protein [Pseudoalteromonas apostichopi]|uniref:DUF4145 domain-containing protein n=1 Tax=Pseudoalteromonas apostichopi TaxID=3035452 RepID=UPI0025741819|nr:DUF4145 domain-containing protein [Pseudoalteromonas sp. FE4]